MSRTRFRAWYVAAYYLSWGLFGLVGVVLNAGCALLLLAPRREALGPWVRRTVRWSFDFWLRWLHFSRAVEVTWSGFEALPRGPTIYIANHPTLVDATVLLARLPDAVCIFKPQLMRNPAVGPAAIMAGFPSGDAGVDGMRAAAAKVAQGRSLLVFPEGTRTAPGELLGELKAGFALIAARARAPVQLIVITATSELAAKGRSWWRLPPEFPGGIHVALDRRWEHDPARTAAAFTEEVDTHLRRVLAPGRVFRRSGTTRVASARALRRA